MPLRTLRVAALLAAVGFAPGVAADVQQTAYSRIELIAEQATVPATGGRLTLGFHLRPNRGWHAYWLNPGDAGKEPSIDWALPDGFAAHPLQFPAPHVIPFGDFNTYGYKGAILLLADVDVPPASNPVPPSASRGRRDGSSATTPCACPKMPTSNSPWWSETVASTPR